MANSFPWRQICEGQGVVCSTGLFLRCRKKWENQWNKQLICIVFFNVPQNLNFLAGQDGQDIKKEWIPALQHRDRDSIGSRTHSDLGRLEEAGRCWALTGAAWWRSNHSLPQVTEPPKMNFQDSPLYKWLLVVEWPKGYPRINSYQAQTLWGRHGSRRYPVISP